MLRLIAGLSGAGETAGQARERRVVLLLLGAWLVNLFDLGFTLLAQQQRLMTELNPLAYHIMGWGTPAIVVYKLTLLGAGSSVLLWQRRRLMSEVALWGYAATCLMLAMQWHAVYRDAEPIWVEAATIREILPSNTYYSVYSVSRPNPWLEGRAHSQGTHDAPAHASFE